MAKDYKLYICGGYVRDSLLGIKSKDIDFAFEFSDKEVIKDLILSIREKDI